MRARVDCPGYRDLLDLGFRDQSQEVIRKSQRLTRKQQRTVPTVATTVDSTIDSTADSAAASNAPSPFDNGDLSPQRSPTYPMQELAKGYLFSHYMSGGPRGGHMSYLVPLINDPRNSAINAALNAVGLAALSNIRLAPQMMLKARREYTTALSQTNHALKDSVMSKRDDILAAVVLLGMFEVSHPG
jgi:phosphoribosylformylglycinamidine (FGAM) synthase PurS component